MRRTCIKKTKTKLMMKEFQHFKTPMIFPIISPSQGNNSHSGLESNPAGSCCTVKRRSPVTILVTWPSLSLNSPDTNTGINLDIDYKT